MPQLSGSHTGRSTNAAALVPYLCLFGVVFLLSSVTLVIKYVFQHSNVQPMGLASARVLIGFIFLLCITMVWDWRGLLSLRFREVLVLTFVGFLGVSSYAIAACGLMRTSVTHYALIYSLLPCCTAALSMLWGKDRIGPVKLTGIALSLVGCVVAVFDGTSSFEAIFESGDMLVLLFTVMMSAHIVLSSNVVKRIGVMTANTVMFGNSAVILCLGSLQEEPYSTALSGTLIAAVAYIGFATAAVFLLRYRSLQQLPPTTVGTYHNLIPVITILLAGLCFGEPLGSQTIIGGVTVVAGAELVRMAQWPKCASHLFRALLTSRSLIGTKLLR